MKTRPVKKAVLDAAAVATAAVVVVVVVCEGVIRVEISLALRPLSAAKTLPIVDVSEYITRFEEEEQEEEK